MDAARKTQIQEQVANLCDGVNCLASDHADEAQAFADALQRQHRTLQQSAVQFLIAGLRVYGKQANTDLRNEAAVDYCKELPDGYFPLI